MFTYGICSSQLPDLETFVLCLRWVEIQGNISVEGIQVLAQVWLLLWNWKKKQKKTQHSVIYDSYTKRFFKPCPKWFFFIAVRNYQLYLLEYKKIPYLCSSPHSDVQQTLCCVICSSCVLYVACFSGFSILDCPFGVL